MTNLYKDNKKTKLDDVIIPLLHTKGKNKKERDELIAEYNYGSDMSAYAEEFVKRHNLPIEGGIKQ